VAERVAQIAVANHIELEGRQAGKGFYQPDDSL
jgi:hypothetical protein